MKTSPVVTVIVPTYNHERFIEETLLSIFAQELKKQTLQVLVLDDSSTDQTLTIIQKLTLPTHVSLKVLRSDSNKGVLANVKRAVTEVNTPYLAFLDGDDKWTHPKKLAAQLAFLEENEDYSGCFHDAEMEHYGKAEDSLFANTSHFSKAYHYPQEVFPYHVLNREMIIPSSSLVMRSTVFQDPSLGLISANFSVLWMLSCLSIKEAKYKYIDSVWSCYRNHDKGISKKDPIAFHQAHIDFLKRLRKDAYYRYLLHHVWKAIGNEYYILLHKLKESGHTISFLKHLTPLLKAQWKSSFYLYKNLSK